MPDDRAAERHPLSLPAGELARLAREQRLDAEDLGRRLDALLDLVLRELPHLEPERHVGVHRLVRVQRVVLEHHRDVAVHRRQVVHHPIADPDLAGADLLQPGDHAQGRGLAATRRADEDHELLVPCVQVDVLHGVDVAVVPLVDAGEDDLGHR